MLYLIVALSFLDLLIFFYAGKAVQGLPKKLAKKQVTSCMKVD